MIKYLLIIPILLITTLTFADEFVINTIVDEVKDGDTYKVLYLKLPLTIRALGIDTLETRKIKRAYTQADKYNISIDEVIYLGQIAKNTIEYYLSPTASACIELDDENLTDTYGRHLGIVYPTSCEYRDKEQTIQEIIIRNGLGEVDWRIEETEFSKHLLELQDNAKKNKLGIWSKL